MWDKDSRCACVSTDVSTNMAEQILLDHKKQSQSTHKILPALLEHVILKCYRTHNVSSINLTDTLPASKTTQKEHSKIVPWPTKEKKKKV